MAPRRYVMTKKKELAAETRQRILSATLKLHGRNGIFGTSWKEIAQEASVAVGTVYKYFPTLDQLVPACGELLMELVQPPQPESINSIIGDATKPKERLYRVALELFAFYERGGRHLDSDSRERELPAVQEWENYLSNLVAGFINEAVASCSLDNEAIAKLAFLFDFPTFRAMRARGLLPIDAAHTATEMAIDWIAARKSKSLSVKSAAAPSRSSIKQ